MILNLVFWFFFLIIIFILFILSIYFNKKKIYKISNKRLRLIYAISRLFTKYDSLKDISDETIKLLVNSLDDLICGGVLICSVDSCTYNKFYDILNGFQEVTFSQPFLKKIEETKHYLLISKEEKDLNSYLIHKKNISYNYIHVLKFYLEDNSYGAFILGSNTNKLDEFEYEFYRIVIDHFGFGVKSKHLSTKLSHFNKTIDVLENTYQKIVDNLPIGIVGIDNNDNSKVILWNELMEDMFDISPEFVINQPIFNIFKTDKNKKLIDRLITRTKISKEVQEISSLSYKSYTGNNKYFLVLSYLVRDSSADFDGTVLVFKETTETALLEQKLSKAQDLREIDLRVKVDGATKELRDANFELRKLNNVKSEFVSIVSHELRTPLTSIRGYASLLLSERLGKLNEQQKTSIKVVKEEGERLSELINDLLDLSKLESGKSPLKLVKQNVLKTVNSALESLEIQAKNKNLTLKVEGLNSLQLYYDCEKIRRVLYNIIGNSIKFTSPEKKIIVKIDKNKDFGIIEVIDQGVGMSKSDLKRIFEPFVQAENHSKRTYPGTGLGLTISKHIIELHHGRIEVKSTLNKGTSFKIFIPKYLNELIPKEDLE